MRALGAFIFAGGFTVGVKRHFEVVGHLEGNDYGVSTARANWPDLDVRYPKEKWRIDDPKFSELDFIYCNPPCAIFSPMGIATTRGKGAWRTDPRLGCWYDSLGLLESLKPRAWALESVPQAYSVGKELVDEFTRAALVNGYSVTHLLLDARWVGLPQSRRRFFLVAHRQPLLLGYQHNWSPPPTVGEALAAVSEPGWVTPFRPSFAEAVAKMPQGTRLMTAWEELNPGYETRLNSRGQVAGRPSFQDRRLNLTEVMGAYAGDKLYHPTENRMIGINEAKALCGYPLDFELRGPESGWGSLLARAVMPPVGAWLAQAIATTLSSSEEGPRRVTLVDVREPDVKPIDLTGNYLKNGEIVEIEPAGDKALAYRETPATAPVESSRPASAALLAQATSASSLHEPEKPPASVSASGPARSLTADRDGPQDAASQEGLLTTEAGDEFWNDVAFIVDCPRYDVDRVVEASELTDDHVKIAKITGLQQSHVAAIVRAVFVVAKRSPAGRPAASPVARVPVESVVPEVLSPPVLESGPLETSRDETVKPPVSRTPMAVISNGEIATEIEFENKLITFSIDAEDDPIPDQKEPSGHFIKRLLIFNRHTPEDVVRLVHKNYPNRTTKVGDVYYNYRQLFDAKTPGLPSWPGKTSRSKPAAAESRLVRSLEPSVVYDKLEVRPLALLTGSTAIQVGSTKTQLKIITAMVCWRNALEALGYCVHWRPVTPGEDLSSYTVVVAALNKPNAIVSSYFYGALWVLRTRPDAIAVVDDWQTEGLVAGIATCSKLKERAFRLHGNGHTDRDESGHPMKRAIAENQDTLFESLQGLAKGSWKWPVLAPTFQGGKVELLKLPARVVPLDPTIFSPRYPQVKLPEGMLPYRKWVQASLHEKELPVHKWSVYHLGFQNRGKGGVGKSGGAAQDRLPEPELMEVYARHWGVLSPPHPHAGSGWWRVRFLMAADAQRVLSCDLAEANVLGGPYVLAANRKLVEELSDDGLLELAEAQATHFNSVVESKDQVLSKLGNLIKERI